MFAGSESENPLRAPSYDNLTGLARALWRVGVSSGVLARTLKKRNKKYGVMSRQICMICASFVNRCSFRAKQAILSVGMQFLRVSGTEVKRESEWEDVFFTLSLCNRHGEILGIFRVNGRF